MNTEAIKEDFAGVFSTSDLDVEVHIRLRKGQGSVETAQKFIGSYIRKLNRRNEGSVELGNIYVGSSEKDLEGEKGMSEYLDGHLVLFLVLKCMAEYD